MQSSDRTQRLLTTRPVAAVSSITRTPTSHALVHSPQESQRDGSTVTATGASVEAGSISPPYGQT
ncbi:MAG: hypothetical protein QM783_12035 [Phycisphaerales bacterium]